jgi:uncharacterized repeat protein (TIGR01451 family)
MLRLPRWFVAFPGRVLVIGLVLAVLALASRAPAPRIALAQGTLDQENTANDASLFCVAASQEDGQTFTMGFTGLLDTVAVKLVRIGTPASPLTVQIRTVAGGIPTSTILSTTTVPDAQIGNSAPWTVVPLATPVAAAAGQQLALVLTTPDNSFQNCYAWRVIGLNLYPGGAAVQRFNGGAWTVRAGVETTFQTFVTPLGLSLTAGVIPTPNVPAGQPLTFTFVVSNTGQAALPNVTFGATLPAGLRPVVGSGGNRGEQLKGESPPCNLSYAGQRAACALGTLAPQQSVTIAITATMLSVPLGANLCATGQVNAGFGITRQAQACTRVVAPARDLTVTKSCDSVAGNVSLGATYTCTITVANNTDANLPVVLPAGGVLVQDEVTGSNSPFAATGTGPGGYGCTTATNGNVATVRCATTGGDSIAPGQSRVFQVSGIVTGGGTISDTATADPDLVVQETREMNNQASATATIVAPDLVLLPDGCGRTQMSHIAACGARLSNAGNAPVTLGANVRVATMTVTPGTTTFTYCAGGGIVTAGYTVVLAASGPTTCTVDLRTVGAQTIAPGGDVEFSAIVEMSVQATATFTTTADPDQLVTESNEMNNVRVSSIESF